jgi:hypothetical protein
MCVIVAKPKGVEPPSLEVLSQCFASNSDGAGFMWSEGDKVHLRKGFMDISSFLRAWSSQEFGADDTVIVHFRIGTSGGVRPEMTHPFPISDDEEVLKKLEWSGEIAMAHNGVLGKGSESLSDTGHFVKDIVSPLGQSIFIEGLVPLLEEAASGDRMVFLNGFGHLRYVGKWHKEDEVWFSNKRWKSYSSKSSTGHTYCRFSSKYDWNVTITNSAAFMLLSDGFVINKGRTGKPFKWSKNKQDFVYKSPTGRINKWFVSHISPTKVDEFHFCPDEHLDSDLPDIEEWIEENNMLIYPDGEGGLFLDSPPEFQEEFKEIENWKDYFKTEEDEEPDSGDNVEGDSEEVQEDPSGEEEFNEEETTQTYIPTEWADLCDDDIVDMYEAVFQHSEFNCPVCGTLLTEEDLETIGEEDFDE